MAWWDHEELKSLENRSERYKREFPEEYKERNKMIDKANAQNKPKYVAYPANSAPIDEAMLFWSDEELKAADLSDDFKIFQIGNEVKIETKIEIISKPVYRGQ